MSKLNLLKIIKIMVPSELNMSCAKPPDPIPTPQNLSEVRNFWIIWFRNSQHKYPNWLSN